MSLLSSPSNGAKIMRWVFHGRWIVPEWGVSRILAEAVIWAFLE